MFTVQLARLAGATVIGTASEPTFEFLRALGAEPVAYGPGLADRLRALVPEGPSAAIDLVGTETALALGVVAERIPACQGRSVEVRQGSPCLLGSIGPKAEVVDELQVGMLACDVDGTAEVAEERHVGHDPRQRSEPGHHALGERDEAGEREGDPPALAAAEGDDPAGVDRWQAGGGRDGADGVDEHPVVVDVGRGNPRTSRLPPPGRSVPPSGVALAAIDRPRNRCSRLLSTTQPSSSSRIAGRCSQAQTASPFAPEKLTSKLFTMRRPLSTGSIIAGRACSHAAAMLCSQNATRSGGSGTSARWARHSARLMSVRGTAPSWPVSRRRRRVPVRGAIVRR